METMEKVGDVKRSPLGALKKLCEIYSFNSLMDRLGKFHSLSDKAIKESQNNKENANKRAMFSQNTMLDILKEVKEEREEETERM